MSLPQSEIHKLDLVEINDNNKFTLWYRVYLDDFKIPVGYVMNLSMGVLRVAISVAIQIGNQDVFLNTIWMVESLRNRFVSEL